MEGQAPLDYAPNVDFPYYVRAENPIIYRGVLPDWGNLVSYETVKRGEKKKVEKKKVVRDGFFSSRDTSFPDFLDGGLVDYLCSSVDYLISNNKKMGTIKRAFQSKEDKAMEYFALGNAKELNENGRREFIDFVFETGLADKNEFLKKIVDAYKEDIKK
jgi:hypothetical protein